MGQNFIKPCWRRLLHVNLVEHSIDSHNFGNFNHKRNFPNHNHNCDCTDHYPDSLTQSAEVHPKIVAIFGHLGSNSGCNLNHTQPNFHHCHNIHCYIVSHSFLAHNRNKVAQSHLPSLFGLSLVLHLLDYFHQLMLYQY